MWPTNLPSSFPSIVFVPWEANHQRATAWKTREYVSNLQPSKCQRKIPLNLISLGAKRSAEVLTRIVSSIEGPCVLALDAPWGLWQDHVPDHVGTMVTVRRGKVSRSLLSLMPGKLISPTTHFLPYPQS